MPGWRRREPTAASASAAAAARRSVPSTSTSATCSPRSTSSINATDCRGDRPRIDTIQKSLRKRRLARRFPFYQPSSISPSRHSPFLFLAFLCAAHMFAPLRAFPARPAGGRIRLRACFSRAFLLSQYPLSAAPGRPARCLFSQQAHFPLDNSIGARYNCLTIYRMSIYREGGGFL